MAGVKTTGAWGGPRKGAGRKPAQSGGIRRNRVVVLLTDDEFAKLGRLADERKLPVGTAAYELVARGLARRR